MNAPFTSDPAQEMSKGSESNSSLFVYNIPVQLTGEGLRNKFAEFGTVQRAVVKLDRHKKPVGFVDMTTSGECVRAITALHNRPPLNWIVRLSQSAEERHQRVRNNPAESVHDPEVEKMVAESNQQFDIYSETRQSVQKLASWLNEQKSESGGSQQGASDQNNDQSRHIVYDRRAVTLVPRPCVVCGTLTAGHCGRCKRTRYCSRACQQQDFDVHAVECCEPELPTLVMPEDAAANDNESLNTPATIPTYPNAPATIPTQTIAPATIPTLPNAPATVPTQPNTPQKRRQPLLDHPVGAIQHGAQGPHQPRPQTSQFVDVPTSQQHLLMFPEGQRPQPLSGYQQNQQNHQLRAQRSSQHYAQTHAGRHWAPGTRGGRNDHSFDTKPFQGQTRAIAQSGKRMQLNFNTNNLVYVSHVVNAKMIYVQPCDQRDQYQQMERDLQQAAEQAAPISTPPTPLESAAQTLFLAMFESVWYRCRLLMVTERSPVGSQILVRFVDWGNTAVIHLPGQLRVLPGGVARQLPSLAICVELSWSGVRGQTTAADRLEAAGQLQDRRVLARVLQQLPDTSAARGDVGDWATAVVGLVDPDSGHCLLSQQIRGRSRPVSTAQSVAPVNPPAAQNVPPSPTSTVPISTAPTVPPSTVPSPVSMDLVCDRISDNLVALCRSAAFSDPSQSSIGARAQPQLVLQCLSSPFLTAGGAVINHLLPLTVFDGDTVERLDSLTDHCSSQSPLSRQCQPGEIVVAKDQGADGGFIRVLVVAKSTSHKYWLFGVDFGCFFESDSPLWSLPESLSLSCSTPLLLCASCALSDQSALSAILSSSSDGDIELQLFSQLPADAGQQVEQLEACVSGCSAGPVSVHLHSCLYLIAAVIDAITQSGTPTAPVVQSALVASGRLPATPVSSPRSATYLHNPVVPATSQHPPVAPAHLSAAPATSAAPVVSFSCQQLPVSTIQLKAGDSYQLLPTSLVHPQLLFGQLQNEHTQQLLASITQQLADTCSRPDGSSVCPLPPVGALLAVLCHLHDRDSRAKDWRRARVVGVHQQQQKTGSQSLTVHLLDWGCDVTVTSLTHCRPLPEALLKVEALEVRFGLFSLSADTCPRDQLGFYRSKLLGVQFRMLVKCVVDDLPQAVLFRENVDSPYVFNERMLSRINATKSELNACDNSRLSDESLASQVSRLSVGNNAENNCAKSPHQLHTKLPQNPCQMDTVSHPGPAQRAGQNQSVSGLPSERPPRTPVTTAPTVDLLPSPETSLSPTVDHLSSPKSVESLTLDRLPLPQTALSLTDGQQLAVLVCDVAAPGYFTATPLTELCLRELERVETAGRLQLQKLVDPMRPDQLVMVFTDVEDGQVWCRACLIDLCDDLWTVYLIDHGTIAMSNASAIRAVPHSLLDIPPLAVNIQLVGDFVKQLDTDQLQRLEQLIVSHKEQSAPLDIQLVCFDPTEQLFTATAPDLFKQLLA